MVKITTTSAAVDIVNFGQDLYGIPKVQISAYVHLFNETAVIQLTGENIIRVEFANLEIDGVVMTSSNYEALLDRLQPTGGGGGGLTPEEQAKVNALIIDGAGDKYLADDGVYRQIVPTLNTNNTSTITMTGDGTLGDPLEAKVVDGSMSIATSNTTNITLTGNGTTASPLAATPTGLATEQSVSLLKDAVLELEDDIKTMNVVGVANNAVDVQTVSKNTTVQLKIDTDDKVLSQSTDGLLANVAIQKIGTPDTDFAAQYKLVGKDGTTALGVTIDILKDQLVNDVTFVHNATQADVDLAATRGNVIELGHTYICFEFELSTGNKWIYLDVSELVDEYTSGNAAIGVSNYKISLVVDPSSHLEVNANGLGVAAGYQLMSNAQASRLANALTDVSVEDTTHIKLSGTGTSSNPLKAEMAGLVEEAPAPPSGLNEILPTNVTTGYFMEAATATNGITYFTEQHNNGIWQLDPDNGLVIPTNVTTGYFAPVYTSPKGITYFGGEATSNSNLGLWKLDNNTGNIVQTSITTGSFLGIASLNDVAYFGSGNNSGIYRESGDTFEQIFNAGWWRPFVGVDGVMYFLSSGTDVGVRGIRKLVDEAAGTTVQTNVTTGAFFVARNIDGTTYFLGGQNNGIWKLDNDTGNIVQTNMTWGSFMGIAQAADGTVYFGSYNGTGIYVLDNETGLISQTAQTTGSFHAMPLSRNGVLFFADYFDKGILRLEKDGSFVQTNITNVGTESSYQTENGDIYFLTYGDGILRYSEDGSIYARRYGEWVDISGEFERLDQDKLSEVVTQNSSTVAFLGEGTSTSPLTADVIASAALETEDTINIHLSGAGSLADPLKATAVDLVEDVPANIAEILKTNDINGALHCARATDGTLYFCGSNGILKLDSITGDIVETNEMNTGYVHCGLSADGVLYFCNSGNRGIKKLDPVTGDIVPTNLSSGRYDYCVQAADGTLYFCGRGNGIKKLDSVTGNIVNTNDTNGFYQCGGLSADGVLYFGMSALGGIRKLDPISGNIVSTNISTNYYNHCSLSSDGTLYFCGNSGIQKLDPDTGNIVPTNITTGVYYYCGLSSNGTMYFCGGTTILKLDPDTEDIVATNTSITARHCGLSSDGILYFVSASFSNAGIWKLDDRTGDIVPTNVAGGSYYYSGLASDDTLYFCGDYNAGIWKLNSNFGEVHARKHQEWLPIDRQLAKADVIQFGGPADEFLAKDGQYRTVGVPTNVVQSTDVQSIVKMSMADYSDPSFTPETGVLYLLS